VPALGVLAYLGGLKILLAVFNMVPALPLDGGRVLRPALSETSGLSHSGRVRSVAG